jgi:hypothetical protein
VAAQMKKYDDHTYSKTLRIEKKVTGLKPRPGSSYNGSCSVNGLEGNLVLIIYFGEDSAAYKN